MATSQRRKPVSSTPGSPVAPITHVFKNSELLTWALTHRSLAWENSSEAKPDPTADNEQLEFLGDAVLGLIAAEALFRRFPASREGELTRLRASIVSRAHLAKVAARIHLGDLLLLGRGEEQSSGRSKPAILANALEAIIAALYLDGGIDVARTFVETHILDPAMPNLRLALRNGDTFSGAIGDHKSALQEHLQATGAGHPHYVLVDQSGPDHHKLFRVQVRIDNHDGTTRALSESEGTTKKQAQQEAARLALQQLLSDPQPPVTQAAE